MDDAAVRLLSERIEVAAEAQGLSLVAAISVDGQLVASVERGLANRAWAIPNTTDVVFGMASVTKGITAAVIMSLVDDGVFGLDDPVRNWLRSDLPLIDPAVTIDHLLTHRSGIGDYLDEEAMEDGNDYVMPIPLHLLTSTESYVEVLDGHPQVSRPGSELTYNNGAYVVLALVAERASGATYHRLASDRVLGPAGMVDSAFYRTDELPSGVAAGYLDSDGLRTNVLHLPVQGTGDGGLYSTVGDLDRWWRALFAGAITRSVDRMTELVSRQPSGLLHYGRGLLLVPDSPA